MSHLFNSPFLRNHKIKIDQDHKSSDSTSKEIFPRIMISVIFQTITIQITITKIFPEIVKRKLNLKKIGMNIFC